MTGSVRSWVKGLIVYGLMMVLMLLAIEGALRLLLPRYRMYMVLPPRITAVFEPDPALLIGVNGPAEYNTNTVGIHGPEFGDSGSEFRVLAVGGSTTENLFLGSDENWPGVLRQHLPPRINARNVWVGDVGRSGMNARDHAVQLKFLLPQHSPIDLIIVLVGVNDLSQALGAGASYQRPVPITDPVAERIQVRRAFSVVPGPFHAPITEALLQADAPAYKRTALYQLVKQLKFAWRQRKHRSHLTNDSRGRVLSRWRANRQSASVILDTLPDLSAALEEYRQNLNEIVVSTRAAGTRVVFLTQPAIWRSGLSAAEEARLWLGGIGDFQTTPGMVYYSPTALAAGLNAFNAALLDTCMRMQVECLDLAELVPRDSTMFYDDVHYTEAGSRRIGEVVADYLNQVGVYAGR